MEDTGTEVFPSGMGESLGVLLSPLVVSGLPKPASLFSSGCSSEMVASAVCSEERMADRRPSRGENGCGVSGSWFAVSLFTVWLVASEENGGEERFDSVELTLMLMFTEGVEERKPEWKPSAPGSRVTWLPCIWEPMDREPALWK